jgi:hypothetical protein
MSRPWLVFLIFMALATSLAAERSRRTLLVSEHGAAASRTVDSYASRSRLPGEYELAW